MELNKPLKSQSAMEYLTTYGWAILVIAIVLGALFSLGLFNPGSFINTSCVFPSEFNCLSAILSSTNSTLDINLQQSTQSAINVTAYGCNNGGTISNMILPYNPAFPASNQLTMNIGGNYTFAIPCFQNGTVVSINPGQVFKGSVIINFTNIQTGFPHTDIGTVVIKTS